MTSSQGRSLRWYWVIGLLFALPPLLAVVDVRFSARPADSWWANDLPADANADRPVDAAEPTVTLEAMARVLPCTVVLHSDRLLDREYLITVRRAVEQLREALPDCRVDWCGDAPGRAGLLRRPRSVIPQETADARHWDRVAEQLLEHPLVAGQTLSRSGTTMLLLLSDSRSQTEATARSILSRELKPLNIEYTMTGEALMVRDEQIAMKAWTFPVLGISTLAVALVGLMMLRDPRRSLAVSVGPASALALAFGWDAFLGLPFNELASADMPVFVLVLAFTDSLHILLAVEDEFGRVRDHRVATRLAMKRMLRPCFLTSLTTSLAFASLMLSDQPMVYGFGRNAAIAICVAFVGVVTAMPLAAAECVRRRHPQINHTGARQDRWIRKLILLGVRRPGLIVASFTVLTAILLIYSAGTLYPDDRIDLRLSRAEPSYQGLIQCDEELGGLRQIKVQIEWSEEISEEVVWDTLNAVQQQVEQSASFSEPLSILNALRLLPGEESVRKLRYARRLATGRLEEFWRQEERTAAVEFRVPDRGIQYIEDDLSKLRDLLESKEASQPSLTTIVGGQCLLESSLVRSTIREMSWSVVLAAATILLVIWIAYGRLSFALFAVLPNTFAITFAVAVRAWMIPSLDIASACAASICLGIAVDDTIHFLEAMRHAKGRFGSRVHILRAGHLVGRALVITSISLLFGFGAVFVAPLPTYRFFAMMVVAMLPAALFGDLVILPAILSMFRSTTVSSGIKDPKVQPVSDAGQQ